MEVTKYVITNNLSVLYNTREEAEAAFEAEVAKLETAFERSPYPCTKDNFLVYMAKELLTYMKMDLREDHVSYGASVNGLVVMKGTTYVTYMTNLSQLKQKLMEEVMEEMATIPNKRKDSIRRQIESLLNN